MPFHQSAVNATSYCAETGLWSFLISSVNFTPGGLCAPGVYSWALQTICIDRVLWCVPHPARGWWFRGELGGIPASGAYKVREAEVASQPRADPRLSLGRGISSYGRIHQSGVSAEQREVKNLIEKVAGQRSCSRWREQQAEGRLIYPESLFLGSSITETCVKKSQLLDELSLQSPFEVKFYRVDLHICLSPSLPPHQSTFLSFSIPIPLFFPPQKQQLSRSEFYFSHLYCHVLLQMYMSVNNL